MLEWLNRIVLGIPIGALFLIGWVVKSIAKDIIFLYNQNETNLNIDDIDLDDVDAMDGLEFEQFVVELLKKNKFSNVRVTEDSGDSGVDVLAKKRGKIWAIQCKCCQDSVGVHAIQEVYSGAVQYGADVAAVITNSYFTVAAVEMAHDLKAVLWSRKELCSFINADLKCQDNKQEKAGKENITKLPQSGSMKLSSKFKKTERRDSFEMATLISAGKYVFGEDIPLGKYNLKVVSGNGTLVIRHGQTENDEDWMDFGVDPDYVHEYRNISLPQGQYFTIDGNLQVEISRSKMLQID